MRRRSLSRFALLLAALAAIPGARAQSEATHSKNVWDVVFSADERFLATSAEDELRLWSLPDGALACRLDGAGWRSDPVPDGGSTFLVTVMAQGANYSTVPQRAFRVDAATCAETPVPLGTAPSGAVSVRPVAGAQGMSVTLPGGRTITASDVAALVTPAAAYTCTMERRSNGNDRVTYERILGDGRPERLAQMKGGCGTLALTPDGRFLTDTRGGVVIDLRRRRLLLHPEYWGATTVGVDAAGERAGVGLVGGYVLFNLRNGREIESVRPGGVSKHLVSPMLQYVAISNFMTERPVVRVQQIGGSSVLLDDARSRAGADATVAARAAEVEAREAAAAASGRQADAERRAARDAQTASREALEAAIEQRAGKHIVARLSQYYRGTIPYQTASAPGMRLGAFDDVHWDVRAGDVIAVYNAGSRTSTLHLWDRSRALNSEDCTPFEFQGQRVCMAETDRGMAHAEVYADGGEDTVTVYLLR